MRASAVLAAMAAGTILIILVTQAVMPALTDLGAAGDEVRTLVDIAPLLLIAALVFMLAAAIKNRARFFLSEDIGAISLPAFY